MCSSKIGFVGYYRQRRARCYPNQLGLECKSVQLARRSSAGHTWSSQTSTVPSNFKMGGQGVAQQTGKRAHPSVVASTRYTLYAAILSYITFYDLYSIYCLILRTRPSQCQAILVACWQSGHIRVGVLWHSVGGDTDLRRSVCEHSRIGGSRCSRWVGYSKHNTGKCVPSDGRGTEARVTHAFQNQIDLKCLQYLFRSFQIFGECPSNGVCIHKSTNVPSEHGRVVDQPCNRHQRIPIGQVIFYRNVLVYVPFIRCDIFADRHSSGGSSAIVFISEMDITPQSQKASCGEQIEKEQNQIETRTQCLRLKERAE